MTELTESHIDILMEIANERIAQNELRDVHIPDLAVKEQAYRTVGLGAKAQWQDALNGIRGRGVTLPAQADELSAQRQQTVQAVLHEKKRMRATAVEIQTEEAILGGRAALGIPIS